MTYFKTKLTSVATLAILALSAPAFAAGEAIGVNAAIKGSVSIQSSGQSAKQAVIKDDVLLGDAVNSQHQSSLQILLKDETIFTVGPECELIIDKFVYNPDTQGSNLSANVAKGMFRFMSGNISKSGADSVSIGTPVASIGVRGTMLEGVIGATAIQYAINAGVIDASSNVDQAGASLIVLRGPGRKSSAKNRKGEIKVTSGGRTVTLKQSGMAVFISDKNTPPSDPFMVSDALFEVFTNKIRTKPRGGPSYEPFELDGFMEWDLPVRGLDEDFEPIDPMQDIDWPQDEDNDQPIPQPGGDCTPNSPDYPDCLDRPNP